MHSSSDASAPAEGKARFRRSFPAPLKLVLALFAALAVNCAPLDPSLSPQARGVLATLTLMVIVWVTEALSFATSAFFLIVSMTLFTAFAPCSDGTALGTKAALSAAVNGFKSGTWFLVVAALFLAAAIQKTGLGTRLVLMILARVGAKPRRLRAGVLALCFVLTFFVPSQAANAALMTAVCIGLMQALSIERQSNLAKGLMLTVGFGCPMAGMGVLTSGAPAVQTADLIHQATGHQIAWMEWLLYGMPFALLLGCLLFWLIEWRFPVPKEHVKDCDQAVRRELASLGPLGSREKRLLAILCSTIFLWSTGTVLHSFDNTTIALIGAAALFLPGIGIASWEELKDGVDWGALMLFGGAISLGQALLATGAAAWVANGTIGRLGIALWPPLALIGAVGLSLLMFSLAFSARAAAVAALIPVAIGFAQAIPESTGLNTWGFSLLMYYAVQFAVILPVNTPMSMIAYSTHTFSAREMALVGVPFCLAALLCMVLLSFTYWTWIGLI